MAKNLANTQDLVAVDGVHQSTVVLKNGGLRQVIMVSGINFSLKSEEEQNIITQAYQNFLNGLNFSLQIIIHSRKVNIERYLNALEARKTEEQSLLLQDQIGEYQEFIRQFVRDNAIMDKEFFVVVPFDPLPIPTSAGFLAKVPFLSRKAPPPEEIEKQDESALAENITQLSQRVAQVKDGLATIGLETLVLNDEQLVELFYNFYNPEAIEKANVPTPTNA
ncbi:MAG: hypothetical protein AAB686_01040 [Patescibacteria group bacterium]